jgi:aspartate aminotransferase
MALAAPTVNDIHATGIGIMRAPTDSRLSATVRTLQPSATLAINEYTTRLAAQGREVFRLGFGQSPFPVPDCVVEALRHHADEKAYLPVLGLPQLREAVAGYYQRTEQLDISPAQVMVGPGSKELMFLLQMACDVEVLIPAPSWVSYAPQASLFNRRVRWLATDISNDWRVTPEQLLEVCREDANCPRLLILNYPSNPTGVTYKPKQLEALAAVAAQFDVLILSDEIYSGFNFAGDHVSIARYYPDGTIISNGLSKWCGAGGWRIGIFVFPQTLSWCRDALAALASETFSAVAAPMQYAAITAFAGNEEIDRYLSDGRRILRALSRYATDNLRIANADVCTADGGFYLFPKFARTQAANISSIKSSAAFCARILSDTGVAMLPGSDFGQPPEDLTARLALVDFDGASVMQALASVSADADPDDAFLRQHCEAVVEGIDRLCAWLANPKSHP